MGSISFLLPNPVAQGAEPLLRTACFAGGYDLTPSPGVVSIENGRLVVARGPNESGYLLVPWQVGPFGIVVASTATLRERDEPYSLLVELARGKLNQVRCQTAEWKDIGLTAPPSYDRELDETTRQFGGAVLAHPSPEADALAGKVLERSFRLADALVRLYTEQMLATRQHEEGKLPTTLTAVASTAGPVPQFDLYCKTFNGARLGVRWRDVEPAESDYNWGPLDAAVAAAAATGMPVTFGPVIDLSPGMTPEWALTWQGDLATLATFMCDFLETLIARYRDSVSRWVVCSGFNHADGLGLADDDRLRLAARLFEAALQFAPDLELVLGVSQPWGDYLVNEDQTISPLAFADDLIRTGLRISGLELELRHGTGPRGSLPRDLLDASRLLDLFGLLGLPLEVVLSHPTSSRADPLSEEHGERVSGATWRVPPTADGQAEWGASFAALAMCKPHVRSVCWDHWSDALPHLVPNGGLLDAAGQPTRLAARLQGLRAVYLSGP